jgi:steroid 5-alpha reductase family enzyme
MNLPTPLILILLGLVFVLAEMVSTFLVARRLQNFGIVDIIWSAGFTPLVFLYLLATAWQDRLLPAGGSDLQGALISRLPLTFMVTLWSLRLGLHLLIRVRAHHPVEDVRYAQLRKEWGAQTDRKMLGFFLLQGALQVVLSAPWLISSLRPPTERSGWVGGCFWLGLLLWAVGILGVSLADRQLARFRADPARRGQVCQEGFWRYSRHPNYFCEWLVWLGYGVFALASPWGWIGLLAPALMYHFLVNVTGVPMTEALSVKSKGEAYRRYQQTTNAFFPGPPRHG